MTQSGRRLLSRSASRALLLAAVIVLWVVLDQWLKGFFAPGVEGRSSGTILFGLIDLHLVHNTGAAWGIFAGNPGLLALFSLLVCLGLLVYFFRSLKTVNLWQTFGIALIVAGGIGNAIDRLVYGYVVDFLATTFMDFPVFNGADIGVTLGVICLFIGIVLSWRDERSPRSPEVGSESEGEERGGVRP